MRQLSTASGARGGLHSRENPGVAWPLRWMKLPEAGHTACFRAAGSEQGLVGVQGQEWPPVLPVSLGMRCIWEAILFSRLCPSG